MTHENLHFIPDDDPAGEEAVAAHKTQEDWLREVQKLEAQRDVLAQALRVRDIDPDTDQDFNFLLGKLSVASEELKAHSVNVLLTELESDIPEQ